MRAVMVAAGDQMMFLDCPAYLDAQRTVRCGFPAEVRCRFTMRSTDGPLESAMIRCPAGHWFTGPIESFTCETTASHHPGTTGAGASAGHDQPQGTHQGRPARGRSAAPDSPTKPERKARRPNGAPGYYLGRPAELWIAAMRPRRGRSAPHLMEAATGGREPRPSTYRGPFTGAHATTTPVLAARAR